MSSLVLCSRALFDHRICELEQELFVYKRHVAWNNAVASIQHLHGVRSYPYDQTHARGSELQKLLNRLNLSKVKCSCAVCVFNVSDYFPLSGEETLDDSYEATNYDIDREIVLHRILTDPREINFGLENARGTLTGAFPAYTRMHCKLAQYFVQTAASHDLEPVEFDSHPLSQDPPLTHLNLFCKVRGWLQKQYKKDFHGQKKFFRFIHALNREADYLACQDFDDWFKLFWTADRDYFRFENWVDDRTYRFQDYGAVWN